MDVKRLFLLRHAKSSWEYVGVSDHDRPLAPRGRRAAKRMAAYLHREQIRPDLILCSSARRAVETLERVSKAFDRSVEVLVEQDLYAAGVDAVLARLRVVPTSFGSVMLIGHNPGMQDLALLLAANGVDRDRLAVKYPTGALATLVISGQDWNTLRPGCADLTTFVLPRDLR